MAGTGGQLYPEAFGQVIGPAYPEARTLCAIVAGAIVAGQLSEQAVPSPARPLLAAPLLAAPLLAAEPLYLRRPDAREPGPPKRVTPS